MSPMHRNRRCAYRWRGGPLFGVAAALLLTPDGAVAASCCGGASASEPFTLSKRQTNLVGGVLTIQHDFDTRGSDGARGYSTGWSNDEAHLRLGAAHRFAPDVQAGVSLPLVLRTVRTATDRRWGGNVGDAGVSGRYELIDDETCYLMPPRDLKWNEMKPSVHWMARLTLPTGRAVAAADDPLGAGITGRGAWGGETGIEVAKVWGAVGNALEVAGGGAYRTRDRRWTATGHATVSVLYYIQYRHSLGIAVGYRREDPTGEPPKANIQGTDISLSHALTTDDGGWIFRSSVVASGLVHGQNAPVGVAVGTTVGRVF